MTKNPKSRNVRHEDERDELDRDEVDGIMQFGIADRVHLCTDLMGKRCGVCEGEMDL